MMKFESIYVNDAATLIVVIFYDFLSMCWFVFVIVNNRIYKIKKSVHFWGILRLKDNIQHATLTNC